MSLFLASCQRWGLVTWEPGYEAAVKIERDFLGSCRAFRSRWRHDGSMRRHATGWLLERGRTRRLGSGQPSCAGRARAAIPRDIRLKWPDDRERDVRWARAYHAQRWARGPRQPPAAPVVYVLAVPGIYPVNRTGMGAPDRLSTGIPAGVRRGGPDPAQLTRGGAGSGPPRVCR